MVRRPTVPPVGIPGRPKPATSNRPVSGSTPPQDTTGPTVRPAPGPTKAGKEPEKPAGVEKKPDTRAAEAQPERPQPETPQTPDKATESKASAAKPATKTRMEPVGSVIGKTAAAAEAKPTTGSKQNEPYKASVEKAAAERLAADKAQAGIEAMRGKEIPPFVKGPFEFVRPQPEGSASTAVALSDYLAVLRREIARAGLDGGSDDNLPMVGIAEAEISLSCVAVGLKEDRLFIDPSWKALAEAPQSAVQQLRVRLVDADIISLPRLRE